MKARETGLRRIKVVTTALATTGVVGTLGFAGLAYAHSRPDLAPPDEGVPAGPTSPAPAATPAVGRPAAAPPTTSAAKPPVVVTPTHRKPRVTTGGS